MLLLYSQVLEFNDEKVVEYTKTKPCMLVVCPHGVISYAGMCSGIENELLPLRAKVYASARFVYFRNLLVIGGATLAPARLVFVCIADY
jgi:hypothetical protein